jgi:hypothetical protein
MDHPSFQIEQWKNGKSLLNPLNYQPVSNLPPTIKPSILHPELFKTVQSTPWNGFGPLLLYHDRPTLTVANENRHHNQATFKAQAARRLTGLRGRPIIQPSRSPSPSSVKQPHWHRSGPRKSTFGPWHSRIYHLRHQQECCRQELHTVVAPHQRFGENGRTGGNHAVVFLATTLAVPTPGEQLHKRPIISEVPL